MRYAKSIFTIAILIVLSLNLQAQNDSVMAPTRVSKSSIRVSTSDSAKVVKHKPSTAVCLSIIPGGGQIYNRKAWKVPIIYAGLCGCGHFIYTFGKDMVSYKNEFINRRDGNTALLDPQLENTPTENLITLKNNAMRNMEIAIGVAAIVYALNMVDAMVDAHLYYFDVSDDLSLQWSPSMMPSIASNRLSYGVSLQLRF